MIWTSDPERDFARYDAEQAEFESRCPECEHCGQPITDDYLIEVDGYYYHEGCFMKEHRIDLDDYLER